MDEVLDKAVRVFCERGYHATSIGDLTDAMALTSGSVYKAFKDKKSVFLAALDRYKTVRDAKLHLAIAQLMAGEAAKAQATLKTVTGNDGTSDLARLWSLYARRAKAS